MRSSVLNGTASALLVVLFVPASYAIGGNNDVYWHIDPSVKNCSMVIDPSLTQAQWKTFTKQAGAILSSKSLASAETLGKMKVNFHLDYSSTPVDQHDPAWINTFVHPDADCPLGDEVVMPSLSAKIGVSDHVDIGVFWTNAGDANYGLVGGECKYSFSQETKTLPAFAVRGSASILTRVEDYDLNVYSFDILASKHFAMLTPYVGLKESLSMGTETTSKVDLDEERLWITQGFAGVTYAVWKLNFAAEYAISEVNTFALTAGLGF